LYNIAVNYMPHLKQMSMDDYANKLKEEGWLFGIATP
jgi:hypothetical protein